jgi:hypothetical protein
MLKLTRDRRNPGVYSSFFVIHIYMCVFFFRLEKMKQNNYLLHDQVLQYSNELLFCGLVSLQTILEMVSQILSLWCHMFFFFFENLKHTRFVVVVENLKQILTVFLFLFPMDTNKVKKTWHKYAEIKN